MFPFIVIVSLPLRPCIFAFFCLLLLDTGRGFSEIALAKIEGDAPPKTVLSRVLFGVRGGGLLNETVFANVEQMVGRPCLHAKNPTKVYLCCFGAQKVAAPSAPPLCLCKRAIPLSFFYFISVRATFLFYCSQVTTFLASELPLHSYKQPGEASKEKRGPACPVSSANIPAPEPEPEPELDTDPAIQPPEADV